MSHPHSGWRAAVLAAAVGVFLLQAILLLGAPFDDPYIFARYAANLRAHGDLLWNPGEPRIEGISSWAWLLVYVVGGVWFPDPVVFARVVGVVLGLVLIALFTRHLSRREGSPWPVIAAAGFLALSPDLAYVAGSGMDHALWALVSWLFLVSLGRAPRPGIGHGIAAGTAILLRPEGFLLFVPLTAALLVEDPKPQPAGRRHALQVLGAGLVLLAVLLLVRYVAFGAWLPNAAASKHVGGALSVRIVEGVLYAGYTAALYLAIPAALWAVSGWRGVETSSVERRTAVVCASFVAALLLFIVVAGGDDVFAFGHSRLLTPTFAPAAYLLFAALRRAPAGEHEPVRALGLLLLVLLVRAPGAKEVLQAATEATNLSSRSQILSHWKRGMQPAPLTPLSAYLRQQTPPGEAIAVPWAGLVPFQTGLPVIDMLGLNDATIRNNPPAGRGLWARPFTEYLLARRPYFICDNYVLDRPLEDIQKLSDAELRGLGAPQPEQRRFLHDPRVAQLYALDSNAPGPGTCLRRLDAAPPAP
ncbi:MAG TPA: hypothetical protein VFV75_09095 [Candidatus Polarisedimenticolaceae bacterium]|nr:hypothetical protein [Candidatus Polarisedimenticolaceae bacterium]